MHTHKTRHHTAPRAAIRHLPDAEGPIRLTMDCFWVQQGWYRKVPGGILLKTGKWKDPAVCAGAVRFLVDFVLAKDPREVTREDFNKNRLRGLLSGPFTGVYAALKAARYDVQPWEVAKNPNTLFKDREMRVRASRWLADKVKRESGRKPREITCEDFEAHGLKSLLTHHYNDSPYEALLDAGLVTQADEAYMRSKNHGRNGN